MKKRYYILIATILAGLSACSNNEEMAARTAELEAEVNAQKEKTVEAIQMSDSLMTVINVLNDQIEASEVTYSAQQKEIIQLVKNVHEGWELVVQMDDPTRLLDYFLSTYKTNAVNINVENMPRVREFDQNNFEKYLTWLSETEEVNFSFGQTQFHTIDIRGDIFVASYDTTIRGFRNNEPAGSSRIYCLMAGQKTPDGDWKVGNYSWVNMESN